MGGVQTLLLCVAESVFRFKLLETKQQFSTFFLIKGGNCPNLYYYDMESEHLFQGFTIIWIDYDKKY